MQRTDRVAAHRSLCRRTRHTAYSSPSLATVTAARAKASLSRALRIAKLLARTTSSGLVGIRRTCECTIRSRCRCTRGTPPEAQDTWCRHQAHRIGGLHSFLSSTTCRRSTHSCAMTGPRRPNASHSGALARSTTRRQPTLELTGRTATPHTSKCLRIRASSARGRSDTKRSASVQGSWHPYSDTREAERRCTVQHQAHSPCSLSSAPTFAIMPACPPSPLRVHEKRPLSPTVCAASTEARIATTAHH